MLDVAKMIFDYAKTETCMSGIGTRFLDAAHEELQPNLQRKTDKLQHTADQIRDLKVAEDADDIAWIDSDAWYSLSMTLKAAIIRFIDPFRLGGNTYFRFSDFLENENKHNITAKQEMPVSIVKTATAYRFSTVSFKPRRGIPISGRVCQVFGGTA